MAKHKTSTTEADASTRKIAERAYHLWEKEGCPQGCDLDHWLRAEADHHGTDTHEKEKSPTPETKNADPSAEARDAGDADR